MKKLTLMLFLITVSITAFSQAREEADDEDYKKVYSIIISREGKVKHVIKQGAMIVSKAKGKVIQGRWFFKAYPDIVSIVGYEGEVLREVKLNKELVLRIATPQSNSGMSIGVGIGPVSINSLRGGMRNFDMKRYHAEIDERKETKLEKNRRENIVKLKKERVAKEAAKKAKKEAKLAAKKK